MSTEELILLNCCVGEDFGMAGSPEPPCSSPLDVPGSQFDEFFFSYSTFSKLLCGNGRLPG